MTPDALQQQAAEYDRHDPLRSFRDRFYLTPGRIYLDGNSLGLLSRDAETATLALLRQWRDYAVEGWTDAAATETPWFFLAETLSSLVAPLIGAEPETVSVTGSTTVNLHQLLATLYEADSPRPVILADALAFPSDIFAIQSHLRLRGLAPERYLWKIPSRDGFTLDWDDIRKALTPDVQIAVLPSVLFLSGQLLDLEATTAFAHQQGIKILWDCSHSIGAVPHHLDAIGADAAFWCHYKYLNAGPGAVAGLYLNRRHFNRLPGLAGWFSSDKSRQFDMAHTLTPAFGAGRLQIGTPHLLSMAPLLGSLRIYQEAEIDRLREKSLRLTAFVRTCAELLLSRYGVVCVTPANDTERGGHIALQHPEAVPLCTALRQKGVVPDFRPPNIIRLAPMALYTSFDECFRAVMVLRELLEMGTYRDHSGERGLVP